MFILFYNSLALPIVDIFFNLFWKEIRELGIEKHWDYLTGLGLILWCIGFGLEKYVDYLTGLELILYIGLGLEKYSNYVTGFGLTLTVYDILDLD